VIRVKIYGERVKRAFKGHLERYKGCIIKEIKENDIEVELSNK
jgi:hypothetical protein